MDTKADYCIAFFFLFLIIYSDKKKGEKTVEGENACPQHLFLLSQPFLSLRRKHVSFRVSDQIWCLQIISEWTSVKFSYLVESWFDNSLPTFVTGPIENHASKTRSRGTEIDTSIQHFGENTTIRSSFLDAHSREPFTSP